MDFMSALVSLEAAANIAKGIKGVYDEAQTLSLKADLLGRLVEAQSQMMHFQAEHAALDRRAADLEQEIMRLKDWSTEAERYTLQRFNPGTFTYVLKEPEGDPKASHSLCANCFDQGVKSILQATGTTQNGYRQYKCHRCRTDSAFARS